MSSRKICVSIFDEHTKEQFLQHPTIFGHNKQVHCVGKEDIVVCYNITTKEIFAIGILRAIDGDKIYRETHPIDQDLYTQEYKQYSKYEIGVHIFLIEPISLANVNELCGLERNTPIMVGHLTSFKMANHISPWVSNALLDAFIHNM
jgi:hypothetical protein